MRKSRNPLLNMSEDRQAILADWLLSGMIYPAAKEQVKKEWGIQASNESWVNFWQEVCVPHLLLKRRRSVETAEAVAEAASARPGRFDQATIDALKQQAFNLSISPGANPKDVKALFSLVLKARDQDLDEKQLELEREKFEEMKRKAAQADQAKGLLENKELSEAEKASRMRELFGLV